MTHFPLRCPFPLALFFLRVCGVQIKHAVTHCDRAVAYGSSHCCWQGFHPAITDDVLFLVAAAAGTVSVGGVFTISPCTPAHSFYYTHAPLMHTNPSMNIKVPKRNLNLHEYQSANIMREHGVNTPKGGVATTPEEAEKVCNTIECSHTHVQKHTRSCAIILQSFL